MRLFARSDLTKLTDCDLGMLAYSLNLAEGVFSLGSSALGPTPEFCSVPCAAWFSPILCRGIFLLCLPSLTCGAGGPPDGLASVGP